VITRSSLLRLLVLILLGWSVALRAADLSQALILVAKPGLRDPLYGSTVLIAKSVGPGEHVGFIVNRPTRFTLGKLFPGHAPAQIERGLWYVLEPDAALVLGKPADGLWEELVRRSEQAAKRRST